MRGFPAYYSGLHQLILFAFPANGFIILKARRIIPKESALFHLL
jgi:hypothetical protein